MTTAPGPAPLTAEDDPELEYADELAELDDGPDENGTDAFAELGPDACADDREIYIGVCSSGPWDGAEVQCRFPRGFLLVDTVSNRVWVYDRGPAGFTARTRDPIPAYNTTPSPAGDSLWRAAEEADFDIRVFDGGPPIEAAPEVTL